MDPFLGGSLINAGGGLLGGLVGAFTPNPFTAGGAMRAPEAANWQSLPNTMKGPWTDQQRLGYAQLMAQLFSGGLPSQRFGMYQPTTANLPVTPAKGMPTGGGNSVARFLEAASRWKAMQG